MAGIRLITRKLVGDANRKQGSHNCTVCRENTCRSKWESFGLVHDLKLTFGYAPGVGAEI